MIKEFKDDLFYLADDYYTKITIGELEFHSATAALLAHKHMEHKEHFAEVTPTEAREIAEELPISEDWEEKEMHYRYKVTLAKFLQNDFLKQRLLRFDIRTLDESSEVHTIFRLVLQAIKSQEQVKELYETQKKVANQLGVTL